MLDKQTVDLIKKSIKEINKEKDINNRLTMLIEIKENIRNSVNEELDEYFSEVDLKTKKYHLDEDYL